MAMSADDYYTDDGYYDDVFGSNDLSSVFTLYQPAVTAPSAMPTMSPTANDLVFFLAKQV